MSDFYNSVEDLFFYRRKNQWKRILTGIAAMAGIIFFLFNLIPVFPLLDSEGYMLEVFQWVKKETALLPSAEYDFWISWGFGILISSGLLLIVLIPLFYWKSKTKKFIDSYLTIFCYSYLLQKELKSYLINENDIHLDNVVDHFKRVTNNFMTLYVDDKSGSMSSIKIKDLNKAINTQADVLELSSKSKQNVEVLLTLEEKVGMRLKKKVEIAKVLPLTQLLALYHFAKIKPEVICPDGEKLRQKKIIFFNEFITELKKLDPLEISLDETARKSLMTKMVDKISSYFINSNIIGLFISWFILFMLLFFLLALILINIFSLKLDSTIFIGILTAPFLGAITMVGIITNQKKN